MYRDRRAVVCLQPLRNNSLGLQSWLIPTASDCGGSHRFGECGPDSLSTIPCVANLRVTRVSGGLVGGDANVSVDSKLYL